MARLTGKLTLPSLEEPTKILISFEQDDEVKDISKIVTRTAFDLLSKEHGGTPPAEWQIASEKLQNATCAKIVFSKSRSAWVITKTSNEPSTKVVLGRPNYVKNTMQYTQLAHNDIITLKHRDVLQCDSLGQLTFILQKELAEEEKNPQAYRARLAKPSAPPPSKALDFNPAATLGSTGPTDTPKWSRGAKEYHTTSVVDEHTPLIPFEYSAFVDPGRSKNGADLRSFLEYASTPVEGTREITLLWPAKDQELLSFVEEVKHRLKRLEYKDKVIELSNLVSDRLGGKSVTVKDMQQHVQHLKAVYQNNMLPLGDFKVGLCRHRAVLYKYLCDLLGISCRMVRGEYRSRTTGWHVWNVIIYRCQPQVVDCMHDPGIIYEGSDARVELCYRRGHNGKDGGAGLMSLR